MPQRNQQKWKKRVMQSRSRARNAMHFKDTPQFYVELDRRIMLNEKVYVVMGDRAGRDSQLWRRICRCRNWEEVSSDLWGKPLLRKPFSLIGIVTTNFHVDITMSRRMNRFRLKNWMLGGCYFNQYKNLDIKVGIANGGTNTLQLVLTRIER